MQNRQGDINVRLHSQCIAHANEINSVSHDAAKNIAFMYSLYESCVMNEISFNVYIEEVLNRIQAGDTDYRSMLPNRIILCSGVQEVA